MPVQVDSRNKSVERESLYPGDAACAPQAAHMLIDEFQETPAELDKKTMAAVADGDETAFAALFGDNRKPVLKLAYGILGDASKAEDIAQEAFVRLWKQAESWESRATVITWLFTVVKHLCLDEQRRLGSQSRAFSKMLYEDTEASQSTDDAYCEKEKASVINEALLELPQRQRQAVQLVYFSECANTEAAEAMKVSVGALESLLSRGRAQLKDRLADPCSPSFQGQKKTGKGAKDKRRPIRLTVERQAQSHAEHGLKKGESL
jgi:RNA polymerase sigma-70 factor (ECF subfamily)